MSEPIQSISQGNYILATQQEVSHDNTLSGTGMADSPLGVVNGYNETVLYSGTYSENTTAVQLSEDFTNFEKLDVWWIQQNARPVVHTYQTENLSQLFCLHGKTDGGQAVLFIAGWNKSNDNLSFTKNFCKYTPTQNWGTFTEVNEVIPVKIIGINRKQ